MVGKGAAWIAFLVLGKPSYVHADTNQPTADEYWNAMLSMFNAGPRLTGSPGHKAFLANVEATLDNLGFNVSKDVLKFDRWEADNYSLVLHLETGDEVVPVGYPFVRSGLTPDEGLTLPFGNSLTPHPHIAITSAPMTPLGPIGCNLQAISLQLNAKAAVCCVGEAQVQLKGEYQPFTNPSLKPGLPTLMIANENCKKLKSLSGDVKATLTLAGKRVPDETAHIYGLLPGQSEEIVMMGIHSDGENAVEENGIPSLLLMAKYLAALPLSARKYTLGFAAVSGHMDYDVPFPETEGFALMHKHDLMKKVKVCVAPEHFGAMQWVFKDGKYQPTGKSVEYTGFGSSFALQSQLRKAFKANSVSNALVLTGPIPESAGSALGWKLLGCPTIGGISLPDYLVNLDHGGPDKLDKGRFFEIANAYMQVIRELLTGAADYVHEAPSYV
jgi:hypothetical protein